MSWQIVPIKYSSWKRCKLRINAGLIVCKFENMMTACSCLMWTMMVDETMEPKNVCLQY